MRRAPSNDNYSRGVHSPNQKSYEVSYFKLVNAQKCVRRKSSGKKSGRAEKEETIDLRET